LLGEKTIINEFQAYGTLAKMQAAGTLIPQSKSMVIATYALCGFANFASIGIQIGGISILAPNQRQTLSELGIKSLIGGTIACFMVACIAGMIIV
jgi:concentrative nucleoside transporter, CNT family